MGAFNLYAVNLQMQKCVNPLQYCALHILANHFSVQAS